MRKKKQEEKKEINKTLEIILTLLAVFLGLFFALSPVHDWAAYLPFRLHFCDHRACIFYSMIWFTFAIIGAHHLIKYYKNEKSKTNKKITHKKISPTWGAAYLIVLAVGLILMNITYCDGSGKMYFDSGDSASGGLKSSSEAGELASAHTGSGSGVDSGDEVEVGGGSGGSGCGSDCEDYSTEVGASNYRDDIATADECYDAAVDDCGCDPSLFSWGLPGEEMDLGDLDLFFEGYVIWDDNEEDDDNEESEDELEYCCVWNCGDPDVPCEKSVFTGCDGYCDKGKCLANKIGGCECYIEIEDSPLTCSEICADWERDKGIIIWNEIYDDSELCMAAGGEVADIADYGDFDMACCCIDLEGENYVETDDAWCVDSDGGVYFDVYGICIDSTSYITADECIYTHPDIHTSKLYEKKCGDDGHCHAAEIHTCEWDECSDNVCPDWSRE